MLLWTIESEGIHAWEATWNMSRRSSIYYLAVLNLRGLAGAR